MDTYFVTSSSLDLCKCKLLFLHGIKSPRAFMCVPTNIIDCCFLLGGPPRNNCWRVIHVLCCKDCLRLAIEKRFLLCVLRTTWSSLFVKWLLLFFVVSFAWGKLFEGDFCFVLGSIKIIPKRAYSRLVLLNEYNCILGMSANLYIVVQDYFLKHLIMPRKHTFAMLEANKLEGSSNYTF